MGRKTHNKDKDWDEIQRLKQENKKLRRRNSKLKKVINQIDLEQYQFVQDLLISQEKQDQEFEEQQNQQKIEERWKCYDCEAGVLILSIFMRAGEPHYLRKCDNCGKRTKLKKYTEEVEGVRNENNN